MLKKAKVIMLPTVEAQGDFTNERLYPCILKHSWVFDSDEKGKLIFANSNIRTPTQLQHLYITSDDEIKEGDWIYENTYNTISKAIYNADTLADKFKKIITTTDTSLAIKTDLSPMIERLMNTNLPQPSQQFISKYIESYNKGNVIEDVLVEYERYSNPQVYGTAAEKYSIIDRLKINSKDNTITIKKLKDSYSRKEVIELFNKLGKDTKYFQETYSPELDLNHWIEENL